MWEWIVAKESLPSLAWEPHLAPSVETMDQFILNFSPQTEEWGLGLCGNLGSTPYSQQLNFIKDKQIILEILLKLLSSISSFTCKCLYTRASCVYSISNGNFKINWLFVLLIIAACTRQLQAICVSGAVLQSTFFQVVLYVSHQLTMTPHGYKIRIFPFEKQ